MTAANLIKETFSILNRFSGAVQFTTEIEYEPGALPSIKLGLAVRIGVKSGADLSGANLSGADISGVDLSGVDLSDADLSGANLSGANLYRADLSGADLYRANLSDADLSGANLYRADLYRADLSGQKIVRWIAEAKRSDGYSFVALLTESSGLKIKAGCRWFSLNEFRAHVADEYPGTDKAAETLDILNFIEARNAFIASQKEAA